MSYVGSMGVLSLISAFFTQSGAISSLQIVLYGLLLDFGRRMLWWLYARIDARSYCQFTARSLLMAF
jgi:hypothetical protein